MTTVSKLIEVLAANSDEPEGTIRQKVRRLQDDGILPVASGRSVPSLEPLDLAAAIIGVFGSDKVKDASKAWNQRRDLSDIPSRDGNTGQLHPTYDREATQLGEFLIQAVKAAQTLDYSPLAFNPFKSDTVFELVTTWPEFSVSYETESGQREVIRFAEPGHFTHWRGLCKKSFSFNGIWLFRASRQLFRTLADAE